MQKRPVKPVKTTLKLLWEPAQVDKQDDWVLDYRARMLDTSGLPVR